MTFSDINYIKGAKDGIKYVEIVKESEKNEEIEGET
eukprot:CAMPEP_0167767442 /NCGR_PEP_ID=MMETSP0110_2-20121227/16055_1 /TAXON_ID=629695 /ORGANISM="Gymnochlora sp., Strain CCMP2014" /LENGTH=35 /DNA_ID= /DNA_START= /DNA_END= /DNA_ORIENTATION=